MSQPPHDPYRRPARPPQQPYGGGDQYGYGAPRPQQPPYDGPYDGPYDAPPQYRQGPPPQPYEQRPPQRSPQQAPQRSAPPPAREPMREESSGGGGFRLPGLGLLLSLIGAIVQVVSFTLLPWLVASRGGETASLYDVWHALTDGSGGGAQSFGDWYVVLFSYPLVVLGILLAFAAVLESVAAKVLWGVLALAGLAFLVIRYGFGPLTGLFGGKSAMQFSTVEIVVAVVALVAIVVIAFTLKTAISMFRRIAGVILIVLSGVHLWAVMDLVKANDIADLDFGAYGPSVGYLLIGIGALIGPRRLLPGV